MKEIYLSKLLSKGFAVLNESKENENSNLSLAALMQSFQSLGYTLSSKDLKLLSKIDEEEFKRFYNETLLIMKKSRGETKHLIFYPNFPKMEHISDEEYYLRAVLHYITASSEDVGFFNQDILDKRKTTKLENKDLENIQIININQSEKLLASLITSLFEQKTPISENEYLFIENFFMDYPHLIKINEIPFKENIAVYFKFLTKNRKEKLGEILTYNLLNFIKVPTDLLRMYAFISNGDLMLKKKTRFISLDRKCRRLFLQKMDDLAENNSLIMDDLSRHEFYFKKAFEKLHVGEYSHQFKNIYQAAKKLRNDDYQTYYANLEINKDHQQKLLSLLKARPGEFARKLDYLLRKSNFDSNLTLLEFEKVSDKVSTNVLIQLWTHFNNRVLEEQRIITLKRKSIKYVSLDETRGKIDNRIIKKLIEIIEEALRKIYSCYPQKGKVYLDPSMKNYMVMNTQRNKSGQHHTLTYGSRIKLDESRGSFLRFFTHWKNCDKSKVNRDRVDIDLSLELIDAKEKTLCSVSWHNMGAGRKFKTFHSGDITTAPDGASEFIDLDYKEARKYFRYALVTNSSYTGQDYCDIPECFSGVMFLPQLGKKGEVFQPQFVKHKFDLTQRGANQNIAFLIDLVKMEMIWLDLPFSYLCHNIVASENNNILIALHEAKKRQMNLYEFFLLHNRHLEFVSKIEEADIIISDQDSGTIKPFDIEKIASEWL